MNNKFPKLGGVAAVIGLIAICLVFVVPSFFITIIDAGEIGIVNTFGSVSDTPLQPGINLKSPFANIIKMNTRTQQYTMSNMTEEGQRLGDDSIQAIAKDGATVFLDVTVFFRLKPEKAAEIYRNLGLEYSENIIRPEIRSTIREKIALFTVTEVFSEKRDELSKVILEELTTSLGERGIDVEDVLLRDVILPDTLIESINQKLAAQQEAEKLSFQIEREKKEAERKVIEAKGQRDAQKIINESLSEKYLYYLYINALREHEGTIYVPTEGGLPLFKNVE